MAEATRRANANLIAAAPELLEQLKILQQAYVGLQREAVKHGVGDNLFGRIMDQVDTAIAKATNKGESK